MSKTIVLLILNVIKYDKIFYKLHFFDFSKLATFFNVSDELTASSDIFFEIVKVAKTEPVFNYFV